MHVDSQRIGNLTLDRVPSRLPVDPHRAAGDRLGIHIAVHDVGVGHGRPFAAARIAYGPRLGARAMRPNSQRPAVVYPRDASAARANLDDVQRRNAQRMSALVKLMRADIGRRPDFTGRLLCRKPGLYQARLRRRPSHIERQHLVQFAFLGEPRRSQHTGRGTRLDHEGGFRSRRLRRHDPAVRLHNEQPVAVGRKMTLKLVEIATNYRDQRGVDDGRARALVLADLRIDIGRQANYELRPEFRPDQFRQVAFMLRIQIRVQQAYRNGLDTLPGKLANRTARIFDVKRRVNRSIAQDSLGHLESQAPRHQGTASKPVGILNIRAPFAAHLQIVAEAARRDVTGWSCSAFYYRVRRDRRSMYEIIYMRRRSRLTNAFDYVLAHVLEQGKHLYRVNFSVVPENDHVGKGAADIKPHTHFSPFRAAELALRLAVPHKAPTRALLCRRCRCHNIFRVASERIRPCAIERHAIRIDRYSVYVVGPLN